MTLKQLLLDPPPGPVAEAASWLLQYAETYGWDRATNTVERDRRPPSPPADMVSIQDLRAETDTPERTIRSHAKRFLGDSDPPFRVDRDGHRGSYRIERGAYLHWRRSLDPNPLPHPDPVHGVDAQLDRRIG